MMGAKALSIPVFPAGRHGFFFSSGTFQPRPLFLSSWRALSAQDEPSEAPDRPVLSTDELELKLGKRRRPRKEKPAPVDPPASKPAPKSWDSMTLAEKAWEFYIGEKGALFWINKLAYASIFAIIGAWIVFRFIGPALGWYQLQSPLLPPDQVLLGSK